MAQNHKTWLAAASKLYPLSRGSSGRTTKHSSELDSRTTQHSPQPQASPSTWLGAKRIYMAQNQQGTQPHQKTAQIKRPNKAQYRTRANMAQNYTTQPTAAREPLPPARGSSERTTKHSSKLYRSPQGLVHKTRRTATSELHLPSRGARWERPVKSRS